MEKGFWVYIVTNKLNGILYIGMTNDLARRCYEHCEGTYLGFTKKYGLKKLVYYEGYPSALESIAREKKLKRFQRDWKIQLIDEFNPAWTDLYLTLNQ